MARKAGQLTAQHANAATSCAGAVR